MSRIPHLNLRPPDHLPDARFASVEDDRVRNQYFRRYHLTHTDNDLSALIPVITTLDEPGRLHSVRVGAVTGGTAFFQVQIDGRDIFDNSVLPESGGVDREPTFPYNFGASAELRTVFGGGTGAPTPPAQIIIELEAFQLLSRQPDIALSRSDRERPSKRQEANLANAGRDLIDYSVIGAKDRQGFVGEKQRAHWEQLGRYGRVLNTAPLRPRRQR